MERTRLGPVAIFKRLYVGFEALKQGLLAGCRRVISLDGCFLMTPLAGQLFSAVGWDGNNQIFPIAGAVVEGENELAIVAAFGLTNCLLLFLSTLYLYSQYVYNPLYVSCYVETSKCCERLNASNRA